MTRLILAVVLLIIAILIAAAVRALILAATRHGQGRHQFDRDLEAMCPTPGDDPVKYAAELLGLPAKGEDYISDQNVRLPWTPPLTIWQPSRTLTEAEADKIKERFLAAQGQPPTILTEPPVVEPADVDAQVAEWQHILAPTERLATDTDVRASLCHCGRPAGHLEAALAGDHPEAAFDTGVIPAVVS